MEVNEAHHWSLRDAPDVVAVAAAYLGALMPNTWALGDYVAQYMFQYPAGNHASHGSGKDAGQTRKLIESLADDGFRIYAR